jgi:3-dehydroquinate synthase
LYDQLIDAQLDRRAIVFALGGGVVGDVAGFAAATYLRGVPLVQIPTTLLSMVDSSVGGKVAVDHPRGKNLIGAFKQPSAVIADTDLLATLPQVEWRSGLAEAIKHGIIGDPELFLKFEIGNLKLEIDEWLPRAIQVKVDVVMRDPFEQGDRAKLNLGHTFGHAFETLSNYQWRHGEAVAMGTVCAARLASRLNLCDASLIGRVENVLRGVGLPTRIGHEFSAEQIFAAMATDKKRVGARLRFILPRAIGEVVMVDDVAREDVVAVIEASR